MTRIKAEHMDGEISVTLQDTDGEIVELWLSVEDAQNLVDMLTEELLAGAAEHFEYLRRVAPEEIN